MSAINVDTAVRFSATQWLAQTSSSPWNSGDRRAQWFCSVSLGGSRFEAGGKKSFPFVGGDDEPREESTTQSSNTAWPLQANDATSVASRTDDSVAAPIGTASLIRGNVTDGSPVSSPPSGSLSVKTDKADYAPGSTATFTATGVMTGSSVTFQIADLTSAPGANGIADVYTPFRVKDGGAGDLDGLANGTVVANWLVPADGRATGAELAAQCDIQRPHCKHDVQ